MPKQPNLLRLDASANPGESASKQLGDRLIERLQRQYPRAQLRRRDLSAGLPLIDQNWIGANFTPAGERDPEQTRILDLSDALIHELKWADRIVLTTPMYNFSVPATVKAWIDLVCRAGITFRYTEDGPVGLLDNKTADIIVTTGGVPLDSPVDFASGYLKQVFNFIGIEDINLIGADQMNIDADSSLRRARAQIDRTHRAEAA